MTLTFLLIAAAELVLGDSGQSRGPDDIAIIDGTPATAADAAVVALYYDHAGIPLCTGVLVAPAVVLTAAHCVAPTAGVMTAPSTVELDGGVHVYTTWIEVHPDFDRSKLENDLALIGLASPVALQPLDLVGALDETWVGRSVRWVGYGMTDPGNLAGVGTKRFAHMPVTSVVETKLASAAVSCNGDSGGAVIDETTGSLVGIISSGAPGCRLYSRATRVDIHASWIRARFDDHNARCELDRRCSIDCFDEDPDCTCLADGECATCMTGSDPDCRADGADCTRDEQCLTSACGRGTCRTTCEVSASECADDESCAGDPGRRLCWPAPTAGCQSARPSPIWMLMLVLVLVLGAVTRRGPTSTQESTDDEATN